MMRKFIYGLLVSLFSITYAYADAVVITRNWCGGFFHRKFVAEATTGAWYYIYYPNGYNATGQYMGTDPYTSSLSDCNDRDAGCSRPRFAYCEKQSTVHDVAYYYANPTPYYIQPGNNYYAKAVAKHEVWGVTLIEQVTNRGLAGSMPSSSVDYEKLKSLSLEGRTNSKVSGNITTENKELICDINGQIQMPVNQDFFVSFKVILFVEDKSLTNEQAEVNEQQVRNGTYQRIISVSEVYMDKNGSTYSGLFENTNLSENLDDRSKTVSLDNFKVKKNIEYDLKEGEEISVMMILDSGADLNSIEVEPEIDSENETIAIFPIPATDYVSIEVDSKHVSQNAVIKIYDIMGTEFELFSGKVPQDAVIKEVDLSGIPEGHYTVLIWINDQVYTKMIVIE